MLFFGCGAGFGFTFTHNDALWAFFTLGIWRQSFLCVCWSVSGVSTGIRIYNLKLPVLRIQVVGIPNNQKGIEPRARKFPLKSILPVRSWPLRRESS